MSDLSEDDSSDDSSKEFLVNPEKLNLNSSFFKTPKTKANACPSDKEESSDDDGFHDVEHSTVELYSQVLQNLETSRSIIDDSGKQESSFAGSQSEDQTLTSTNEITELLLRGEAASSSFKKDSEESEESEEEAEAPAEYSIPKEGIRITLPGTEMLLARKKKKGAPDPLAILRKHFRETQLVVVKVSLLCWLGHGFHLNRLINEPDVMAVSLSLLSSTNYPKSRIDLAYLEKLAKWFTNLFKKETVAGFACTSKQRLLSCAQEKKIADYSELVLLFVALLRALGFNSRLVVSLCPPQRKLPESLMSKTEKQSQEAKSKKKSSERSTKEADAKTTAQKVVLLNSSDARKTANAEAKKRAAEILKAKAKNKPGTSKTKNEEAEDPKVQKGKSVAKDEDSNASGLHRLRTRRVAAIKTEKSSIKKEEDSDSEVESIPPPKRTTRRGKKEEAVKQEGETTSKYYKDTSKGKSVEKNEDPNVSGLGRLRTKRMAAVKTEKGNPKKEEDSDLEIEAIPPPKRTTRRGKTEAPTIQEEETTSKYYKDVSKNTTEALKRTRANNSRTKTTEIQDDTVSKYYKKEETGSNTETLPQKKPRVAKATAKTKTAPHNSAASKTLPQEDSDSEIEFQDKKRTTRKARTLVASKKSPENIPEDSEDADSEEEFKPEPKRKTTKAKSAQQDSKPPRKLLSSDTEEDDDENAKNKENLWAEVFLESEDSWISVCLPESKVHCTNELYKRAKKPVLYVVAWNFEGRIKDVTRRYCKQWLTVTRKKRVNEDWWTEAISPWKEKNTAISRAEDEMLLERELAQPLPKTVAECKGHPLYVLQRHLLKYEALYPPDCVPLGHIKTGEPIYSRHCVHTLRSRETWVKHARVVKPNQEAYKIVKSLPKYDKLSGTKIKDAALEIFGEWQTTEYIPPTAKDGIVPRNEYGNVDLFQRSMLPKGTVHINRLNRVARKLNIDCAPAVVGFNFGGMGAVPAFEGFVVCEEFEDTLREAWETEQVESMKRAKEKREKRIYGNWRRLIQGLFIRERLAVKYEFAGQEKATTKRSKQKTGDTKKPKVS